MPHRILLVEDDVGLAGVLYDNLTFEGFQVERAADGNSAVQMCSTFHPDLVVLDIGLPDTSGFELIGPVRRWGRTPIIILTAHSQKAEKLHGLHLGADDYITKPFDLEEFLARVRAVLSRVWRPTERLCLGATSIDVRARTAKRGKRALHLTHLEYEVIRYLADRPGQVVHRDELLRHVWGYVDTPITRSVDNAIVRLRKKIEPDPQHPRFIHTVHGDGYSLTPDKTPHR